jgi:hypothetical protein
MTYRVRETVSFGIIFFFDFLAFIADRDEAEIATVQLRRQNKTETRKKFLSKAFLLAFSASSARAAAKTTISGDGRRVCE